MTAKISENRDQKKLGQVIDRGVSFQDNPLSSARNSVGVATLALAFSGAKRRDSNPSFTTKWVQGMGVETIVWQRYERCGLPLADPA